MFCLTETFSKNSYFDGISLPAFPSGTNLNLYIL